MTSHKANRFLIDRIDQRLGSVEKEIKFDKIAICVCTVIMLTGILLSCLGGPEHAGMLVLGIMLVLLGITILYVFVKELISDTRRVNNK